MTWWERSPPWVPLVKGAFNPTLVAGYRPHSRAWGRLCLPGGVILPRGLGKAWKREAGPRESPQHHVLEEATLCPQPQVGCPPPRQLMAQDSIRLQTGNPQYVFTGAGARGISSEWKEKAPPHLETVSSGGEGEGGAGRGGSPGVPLIGCTGPYQAVGTVFPPPRCGGKGC